MKTKKVKELQLQIVIDLELLLAVVVGFAMLNCTK